MNAPGALERWNAEYFDGQLSPVCLALLANLPSQHPEVVTFAERSLRAMHGVGLAAQDVSELFAWELGHILPKIHPRAWGGMVPPITLEGRHTLLDEYVAGNTWDAPGERARFVDIGCGFPPLTTVDTAQRFPAWNVIGTDPAFGRYLVADEHGDYAVFNTPTQIRYFQAARPDPARWEALTDDPDATRARFRSLLDGLRGRLDDETHHELQVVQENGARLAFNPIREYERPNLRFEEKGLHELDFGPVADVVRCFNVLMYFDRATRDAARRHAHGLLREGGLLITGVNWSRSTYARYFVEQRIGDALVPREFAFGIENVRPMEILPFYSFFEDEEHSQAMLACVRLLRKDQAFLDTLNVALDELCATHGICPRRENGYLGTVSPNLAPDAVNQAYSAILAGLEERGIVEQAVVVLKGAGIDAWRNPVGHVAVRPADLPEAARLH